MPSKGKTLFLFQKEKRTKAPEKSEKEKKRKEKRDGRVPCAELSKNGNPVGVL